ncbi:hypothetical protein H1Q63_10710 [Desmonostoc muscorum CCALA 125]|nr:hypothetical protein [Desmonostoc muscorum CCALA 125]
MGNGDWGLGIRKSNESKVRSYEFKFLAIPVPSPQSPVPNSRYLKNRTL